MNLLFLTILFPIFGFFILALSQGNWSERRSAIFGVGSIGISTLITIYIIVDYYRNLCNNANFLFIQKFCTWFKIDEFCVDFSIRLDGLSITMLSLVMGIGLIIHIYACWYMSGYEGYSRFFAYTNLFMSNMILLILSDNLLLMYFGWEGVGLCSYLLIGFNYFDLRNGREALRAFIITRVGDICLLFALFMIYDRYHTLNFSALSMLDFSQEYYVDSNLFWISLMLLVGAIGKSAQLPFHTWLISAMVGPTPVSALIHAATMVTSGVYLIIRMNNFFMGNTNILYLVGVIGALTIILFSFSALMQNNIKKILAYSTVSQIGYMFLSLGGGYWFASMFHLITHAFFKALLFLSTATLVAACRDEQDIFKMGGLYKSIPLIYVCFLVGGASLSALPFVTSGFYSKEMILLNNLNNHNYFFWISGLIGAFLTSLYTFRMIFIIFHGEKKIQPDMYEYKLFHILPLVILMLFSTCIGDWLRVLLSNVMFNDSYVLNDNYYIFFNFVSSVVIILGVWIASFKLWKNDFYSLNKIQNVIHYPLGMAEKCIMLLCYHGWGFSWLYEKIFVTPYLFLTSKLCRFDFVDIVSSMIISFLCWLKKNLSYCENRKLNWYIISVNVGVIVLLIVTIMSIIYA